MVLEAESPRSRWWCGGWFPLKLLSAENHLHMVFPSLSVCVLISHSYKIQVVLKLRGPKKKKKALIRVPSVVWRVYDPACLCGGPGSVPSPGTSVCGQKKNKLRGHNSANNY